MENAVVTLKQIDLQSNLPIVAQARWQGEDVAEVSFEYGADGTTTITAKGAADFPTCFLVAVICASHHLLDTHFQGEEPQSTIEVAFYDPDDK